MAAQWRPSLNCQAISHLAHTPLFCLLYIVHGLKHQWPGQAHGGGVIFHKGLYYWFGEHKGGATYVKYSEA